MERIEVLLQQMSRQSGHLFWWWPAPTGDTAWITALILTPIPANKRRIIITCTLTSLNAVGQKIKNPKKNNLDTTVRSYSYWCLCCQKTWNGLCRCYWILGGKIINRSDSEVGTDKTVSTLKWSKLPNNDRTNHSGCDWNYSLRFATQLNTTTKPQRYQVLRRTEINCLNGSAIGFVIPVIILFNHCQYWPTKTKSTMQKNWLQPCYLYFVSTKFKLKNWKPIKAESLESKVISFRRDFCYQKTRNWAIEFKTVDKIAHLVL
jgi:peptide methionine sulfoxide reductase MsrB